MTALTSDDMFDGSADENEAPLTLDEKLRVVGVYAFLVSVLDNQREVSDV